MTTIKEALESLIQGPEVIAALWIRHNILSVAKMYHELTDSKVGAFVLIDPIEQEFEWMIGEGEDFEPADVEPMLAVAFEPYGSLVHTTVVTREFASTGAYEVVDGEINIEEDNPNVRPLTLNDDPSELSLLALSHLPPTPELPYPTPNDQLDLPLH